MLPALPSDNPAGPIRYLYCSESTNQREIYLSVWSHDNRNSLSSSLSHIHGMLECDVLEEVEETLQGVVSLGSASLPCPPLNIVGVDCLGPGELSKYNLESRNQVIIIL